MRTLLITLLQRSLGAFALLVLLAGTLPAGTVLVFAAASLTDALKELGASYEKETGNKATFSFAGSNLLARQIAEGAPADLFASADWAQMDRLQSQGLVDEGSRVTLLSNQLVAVGSADSALAVTNAAGLASPAVVRLALADPRAVPAGIYAKTWLKKLGLWGKLIDKIVPTENVRGALQAVESGNVEAAVVYASDASISKKVRVLFAVPREEGPTIAYPFAVLKEAPHPSDAAAFLTYLRRPASLEVFLRYGFLQPLSAP